jgi:CBS domain-containing protein
MGGTEQRQEGLMKVKDFMTTDVLTVREETSFKDTVELLVEHGVSGVPVIDAEGRLVGLVTEADLVSKEAFDLRHRRPLAVIADILSGTKRWSGRAAGLTAGQVMSDRVVTVTPDEDVRYVARRMLELGVKRFPVVVDDDFLVGIISRHDLLRVFHRSDAEIAADIDARLANPMYAPEDHSVSAVVEDGVVTLFGSVRFSGELPGIVGLASNVVGVIHVDSRLTADVTDVR